MLQKNRMPMIFMAVICILFIISLCYHQSFIGYSVVGLVGLTTLLKPKWGLLILPVYFPIRPLVTELNPGLKVLGDLIIIILFLRTVVGCFRKGGAKSIFSLAWFEWAFIAYCLFGVLVGLYNGYAPVSLLFQFRAFIITYLLFYSVKRMDPHDMKEVKTFLWLTLSVAVALCIHGLVEKLSLRTLWLPEAWVNRPLAPTNAMRIYGMIDNPNVLAYFLGISFMTTMYLRTFYSEWKRRVPDEESQQLRRHRIVKRITIDIGLVLIIGIFLLTYSRGSIIAFMVVLFCYIVLSSNVKVVRPLIVYLVLGIFLVFFPANQAVKVVQSHYDHLTDKSDVKNRFAGTFADESIKESANGGRLFVVKKGLKIFAGHPIIGTGFGSFGDSATHAFGSPIYKEYHVPPKTYADNQYIEVIVQTGLVGVILFAVFLLGMFAVLWKGRKTHPFALTLLSLLLGVVVSGMYYNIWEDKTFTLFFFIIFGTFYMGEADKPSKVFES